MRLLHTLTGTLHDFQNNVPPYAILSHRWEANEISLQELQAGTGQHKAGWEKVRKFCGLASTCGYHYGWVDTCCIDKSSSAELQEAINSMFKWYREAAICFSYLSDVSESSQSWKTELRASMWFTRGWTLQELLAPRQMFFVSRNWKKFIGARNQLAPIISEITGIPTGFIQKFYGCTTSQSGHHPHGASIAEVMSWAATRVTSREEDIAYSLMGLFGVQMPLLYGEGRNAFIRLQLEIIKMSDDESIFAWQADESLSNVGLLAPSPYYFRGCSYVPLPLEQWDESRPPFLMTNKGLRIEPKLQLIGLSGRFKIFLMPLNCYNLRSRSCAAIYLKQIDKSRYVRIAPEQKLEHDWHKVQGFLRKLVFVDQIWQKGSNSLDRMVPVESWRSGTHLYKPSNLDKLYLGIKSLR